MTSGSMGGTGRRSDELSSLERDSGSGIDGRVSEGNWCLGDTAERLLFCLVF
jgi:hypothetical protein